jgi:hypothetical protein
VQLMVAVVKVTTEDAPLRLEAIFRRISFKKRILPYFSYTEEEYESKQYE